MLLLVPTTLAMILALLRGGSLRQLATLRVQGRAFFIASLGIQVLFYVTPLRQSALAATWGSTIYCVAMVLAGLGALCNWQMGWAARLATVGILLNITVIVANGGHMPVNAAEMQAIHGLARVHELANTHLYGNTRPANAGANLIFLSDIIPIRLPNGYGNVYSIGDMLLSLGAALLAFTTMVRVPRPSEPEAEEVLVQRPAA